MHMPFDHNRVNRHWVGYQNHVPFVWHVKLRISALFTFNITKSKHAIQKVQDFGIPPSVDMLSIHDACIAKPN